MKNYKEEVVCINQVKLNVITAGDPNGKCVLILHGFPEDAASFTKQISFLSDNGYFVIAPDQRGYGKSERPQEIKDYTLDILGKDIIELLDHYKLERVYLLGHDWGCVVSWYLLTMYPQYFIQSILMSAPHFKVMRHFLTKEPKQIFKSWYIFLIQLPKVAEYLLSIGDYRNFAGGIKKSCKYHSYPKENLNRLKENWIEFGLTSQLNWYRAMRFFKFKMISDSSKEKIAVPLTLVWGKDDPYLLLDMAEASIKYCEQATLKVFSDSGHWPHHEHADEINLMLQKF